MLLQSVDSWLDGAARHLAVVAPDLSPLVADYVGEARFGASEIAGDLAALPPGAHVLEVGAGALLLSCALQAAGFRVTALEPVGAGFSHMAHLRGLVLEYASPLGCAPELLELPAEALDRTAEFDFAFSINVMEHVGDVAPVLRRVWLALRPSAGYRFVCPNYRFPFEPHFGIPTAGGKALTWRIFRRRILASRVVVDPAGTWASLNWITVALVRQICQQEFGVQPRFDRAVSFRFVQIRKRERSGGIFSIMWLVRWATRAGRISTLWIAPRVVMRRLAAALDATGLIALAKLVPAIAQPAMSCRLARPA